jgi:hypothetical protein
MRLTVVILAGLACVGLAANAKADLQDALVAREVMADLTATCVVRIDYTRESGSRPSVFALAFRLENVVWLYSPEIGTRALGEATAAWPDSSALAARLRRLDPAIRRVTVYPRPVEPLVRQEQRYLDNACVIASLHCLGELLNNPDRVTEVGLILMAFDSSEASDRATFLVNHCVLAFREDGRWWCLDPNDARRPFLLKTTAVGAPLDPALVALALQQAYPLKSVHLLMLSPVTLNRIATNMRWRHLAALQKPIAVQR